MDQKRRTTRKGNTVCENHADGPCTMVRRDDGTQYCPACALEKQSRPPVAEFTPLQAVR